MCLKNKERKSKKNYKFAKPIKIIEDLYIAQYTINIIYIYDFYECMYVILNCDAKTCFVDVYVTSACQN